MAEIGGSSPPAAPRPWLASELGVRVVSAVVLAVIALSATYEGGWLFALFWLLAGVAIVIEWVAMTRVEPRQPVAAVLSCGLAILAAAQTLDLALVTQVVGSAAVTLAGLALCASGRDRLWALSGFLCAAVIVLVPPAVREHPEFGLVGLLWMLAVVWVTDVAAYFVGRRLGGPKLWPRVSPKKTWSGFFGGLLAGTAAGVCVVAVAVGQGRAPLAPLWLVATASAVGSVVGQMGDLAESALKRLFEVKDSSRLIPGHGGVMDRLDAFWAVCALAGLMMVGAQIVGRW